jgi:hypothetical protein
MGRIGWCYVVAFFLSVSVDGRSVLFAPAALVAAVALVSLAVAVEADPPRRWLGLAAVAAGATAALSAVAFVPGVDDGGPGLLAVVSAAVSAALYAHGIGQWCATAGWRSIAEVWTRATRAAIASVVVSVASIVVVLQEDPAGVSAPADGMHPDTAFGREVGGAAPVWWMIVLVFAALVVTAWRVAKGHRSMRAAFDEHGTPTASLARTSA